MIRDDDKWICLCCGEDEHEVAAYDSEVEMCEFCKFRCLNLKKCFLGDYKKKKKR